MELSSFFPMWEALDPEQRRRLTAAATERRAKKGQLLHGDGAECTGLILVSAGRLRAYVLSEDGREITLYRLLDRDMCLFSASCALRGLQLDITIQAETDAVFWLIPAELYKTLTERSAPMANFTNQLMAERFSQVMWLLEQVLWQSQDKRLAAFLLEESALEGAAVLSITHESIARHLGTAREVVTRMLRYFQEEGMVALRRGSVELLDLRRLRETAGE